ncbi:MAG: DUF4236 domain-containing protein [Bacteroidales bacterium]|nr:DUF4236 domain-containing protein [Bacteroidales bacterium]
MQTVRRRRRSGYYRTQTRRIKIFPGVYVNVGQSGVSLSLGNQSAKATVGKTGTNYTVKVPGTGLSYRKKVSSNGQKTQGKSWISYAITALIAAVGIISNKKSKTKTSSK